MDDTEHIRDIRRRLANARKRLLYWSGRMALGPGAKRFDPRGKHPMQHQAGRGLARDDVTVLEKRLAWLLVAAAAKQAQHSKGG